MGKSWPRLVWLVLVLALALVFVSCAADEEADDEPEAPADPDEEVEDAKHGGDMVIVDLVEGAMPIGIPWQMTGIDTKMMWACVESLIREDVERNPHPELATDWEIEADEGLITFELREGVKFHDGTDFDAEAAKWNLDKQIEHNTISGLEEVVIVDDHTIELHFDKYFNTVLTDLSGAYGGMISPTAFEENGEDWARHNPVGTGPFEIEEYEINERLTYTRFDDYWDDDKPYLDSLTFEIMGDPMTQRSAMEAGEIDVLCVTDAEQASYFEELGYKIKSMSVGPVSLVPSSDDPDSPLSEQKVRQAISHAIDRESIVEARGFGIWDPECQPLPPESPAHIDGWCREHDVDRARELLEEAGYDDGFEATINAMPGMVDPDAMVIVQSQLAEVGIDINVETPDGGRYTDLRWGGHDGFLAHHIRDLGFNRLFHIYFRTDVAETHFPSTRRPEGLMELLEASMTTPEPEGEKGQAMTELFNEDQTIIPLYNIHEIYIMPDYVMDTGYTEWSDTTIHLPGDTWFDK